MYKYLLLFLFFVSGCTSNIGEFTVLSTRNVEFQVTPTLVKEGCLGFYFKNDHFVDHKIWKS